MHKKEDNRFFRALPPYRRVTLGGSVALVAFTVWAYRVASGPVPAWSLWAAAVVAVGVGLLTFLHLWLLVRDYQQGYLYPLRNATLFLTIFTVVALPVILVRAWLLPGSVTPGTLLLLPVFLALISGQIFRVRIDQIGLEVRLGFRTPEYVPLFQIERVEEDEDGITIHRQEGPEIRLLRVFFLAGHWARLRARLAALDH